MPLVPLVVNLQKALSVCRLSVLPVGTSAEAALLSGETNLSFPAEETLDRQKKERRHGIRNARQYRSPGLETLLRNHDLRGRQRDLQGHQRCRPGRGR